MHWKTLFLLANAAHYAYFQYDIIPDCLSEVGYLPASLWFVGYIDDLLFIVLVALRLLFKA